MKKFTTTARLVLAVTLIVHSQILQAQWTSGELNTAVQTTGGNVGIGISNPVSRLHIANGTNGEQLRFTRGTGVVRLIQDLNRDNIYLFNSNGSRTLMYWNGNGNVGLGTRNPLSRLSVNGGIRALEVRILTDITIPDYVFEDTYKLRKLSEVESFIKEHKHLPEIPSAKEIKANGINVAEMDALLLKKIEELTLYIIDQDRKLKRLEEECAALGSLVKVD